MKRSTNVLPHTLMVFPAVALFAVFFIVPVIRTIQLSFTNQSNFSPVTKLVGFENYSRAVIDPTIIAGVGNSLWYALATVVLQSLIALPVAVLLNSRLPFRNGFRAIFFTPAVLSTLVIGYLWSFILSADSGGLINSGLTAIGLPAINWLGDSKLALWSVILTQVWQWFGWAMVIYLANLQSISQELYEAASLDGADRWQQFLHITLPGLLPAIQINLVTGFISGLKVFDIVYSLTGGGPGGSTETVLTLMYQTFSQGSYGYAASFGVLFLIVTVLLTAVLLTAFRKLGARYS